VYGKVAVGIEKNELIAFNLIHHPENEVVKIQSSESLRNIQYKIYSVEGKTMKGQDLPESGLIRTGGLPAGTHVVSLFGNNKVVGMKKLVKSNWDLILRDVKWALAIFAACQIHPQNLLWAISILISNRHLLI
jgi:hypothetical protein